MASISTDEKKNLTKTPRFLGSIDQLSKIPSAFSSQKEKKTMYCERNTNYTARVNRKKVVNSEDGLNFQ